MQLDFNILWIENNKKWRDDSVKKIENFVLGLGFNPIIEVHDNGEFLYEQTSDLAKHDLIFMDYNLDDEENSIGFHTGDKIIKKIRENKVYSNVIFYSTSTNDLPEKAKVNDIQNTFIFEREDFRDENIDAIFEVIEYILNKANSINIMRGIIMAELASFDNLILNIINSVELDQKWEKIYSLITKGHQRKCKEIINNCIEFHDKKDILKENCELVRSKNDIEQIKSEIFDENKSSATFNSAARANFLNTILKEKNVKLDIKNDFIKNYNPEIIQKRNKLGHCIKIEECSDEDFLQLRKNILKHRKNLEEIKVLLSA